MDLIANLNRPQREAVLHGEGPLLILAGAGSGKTRVITHRIANLVHNRSVNPGNILAVTFTNKAAKEMATRVQKLLGRSDIPYNISTFHAACGRILRKSIDRLGYAPNFTIYDERDSERLLKDVIASLNLDEKKFPVKGVSAKIDDFKNRAIFPDDIDRIETPDIFSEKIAEIYSIYQERLKGCNSLDFGDLLLLAYRLLNDFTDVRHEYQERFQWILVDEYQDTNPVQYRLIRLLAGERKNLCVVGDDDQSIYSWRGADIRNILEFEKDFPGVRVIRLEQNYRSTGNILKAAGEVIKQNFARKGKTLWTDNPEGSRIKYKRAETDREEARFVSREIDRLAGNRIPLDEIAVFYRTNAQSRQIEESLVAGSIPYHIVGGVRFYSRLEIKDILAYLKVLDNPSDDVSLLRIINVPPRGIGPATIERLTNMAAANRVPLYSAIIEASGKRETTAKLTQFLLMMEEFRHEAASLPLPELAGNILEKSGYLEKLKNSRDENDAERLENLGQFLTALKEFSENSEAATLSAFLEQVSLVSDLEQRVEGKSSVALMTLHAAKGLEFRVVFMIGMEESLFPHLHAFDDLDGMEEERRLCYVGMTRAKEHLYLLNAGRRYFFGKEQANQPSRFLKSIPRELLEEESFSVSSDSAGSYGENPALSPASVPKAVKPHNLAGAAKAMNDIEMIPEPPEERSGVYIGMKVRHGKFGRGTIRKIEGYGDTEKVIVWFDSVGPKKLMLRVAGLEAA